MKSHSVEIVTVASIRQEEIKRMHMDYLRLQTSLFHNSNSITNYPITTIFPFSYGIFIFYLQPVKDNGFFLSPVKMI